MAASVPTQVVFRVDASPAIGLGHLKRCITLADALGRRGALSTFICRSHEGHFAALIEQRGHPVIMLPRSRQSAQPLAEDYETWLGATRQADALETRAAIVDSRMAPDWLVADHYGIDLEWEAALRPMANRIMVIDDLSNRSHDCDLLLDQNLILGLEQRYAGRIPADARILAGPHYALIGDEYRVLHERLPPRSGRIHRLLVSFGGADENDFTGRTLRAITPVLSDETIVDVVVSSKSAHLTQYRRFAADRSNIRLHVDLPSLASLMATADLAIGAAGSTSWERLCLGLPSIVIAMSDNQLPIAEGLQQARVATWIGSGDIKEKEIATGVQSILTAELDEERSARCFELVDGRGTDRVCAALLGVKSFDLRGAKRADLAAAARWAGGTHASAKLENALRAVGVALPYVITAESNPVAFVECELQEASWRMQLHASPVVSESDADEMITAAISRLRDDISGPLRLEPAGTGALDIAVCSDAGSWIGPTVAQLMLEWQRRGHRVTWVHNAIDLEQQRRHICFYLGYGRIVNRSILDLHERNLVVHASDLPRGRGWSPLTWQILEGKNRIPVSLFEAQEEVDSGAIYDQVFVDYEGSELIEELHAGVARATYELAARFVDEYPASADRAREQVGEPTFYERRRPRDSRMDADQTLKEQFQLLRVADPQRYPTWTELAGRRFAIRISPLEDGEAT